MDKIITLESLGWNEFFSKSDISEFALGRISVENKQNFLVLTEFGECIGEITGKMLHSINSLSELPKVGDWVEIQVFENEKKCVIHNVLKRKSKFSRKVVGEKVDEQILAVNIDYVFIIQSLDSNFNKNRIERYLVMINEGNAKPVIVLNKADLCENVDELVDSFKKSISDVPVFVTSCTENTGLEELKKIIKPQNTFAFVGSSGVGKSSLINKIIGIDVQKIDSVREGDSKGRHTTAKRELIVLPQGGILIDTPGLRELQLWESDQGLLNTFPDIQLLSEGCKFSDCTHTREIKCAVLEALKEGTLEEERYHSYIKLHSEIEQLKKRDQRSVMLEKKRKDKILSKTIKRYFKSGRK